MTTKQELIERNKALDEENSFLYARVESLTLQHEEDKAWRQRAQQAEAELEALKEVAREVVICSALRLPDGRVIRGHRHGDCLATAYTLVTWQNKPESGVNGPPWEPFMDRDQGFVTSRNRFVGREEAYQLQVAAGIDSVAIGGYRGETLYSEDLY